MIKKLLGTIVLCVVLVVQNLPAQAAALEPRECPKDLKYLLGMYYGNGEQFVIRERDGELELLYRTTREDYKFANSNQFLLKKERFDSYTLLEAGPMNNTETSVRFERDPDGYGITCKIGGNRYSRAFFGSDRGKPFRIPQPSLSGYDPAGTAGIGRRYRSYVLQAGAGGRAARYRARRRP